MGRWWVAAAVVLALSVTVLVMPQLWRIGEVSGAVTSNGRPIEGAVVRLKATGFETRSDAQGVFRLAGFPSRFRVPVTAWIDGYYVGGAVAWPWRQKLNISIQPYLTTDNPDYQWVRPEVTGRTLADSAFTRAGLAITARLSFNRLFLPLASKLTLGCADCHGSVISRQFASSTHSAGTANIRFMTVYNGSDVEGNKSPPPRHGFHRDYGRFPLRPDAGQPWYGPGFKLDFPDQAGNCANCHMPGEAIRAPHNTDINSIPTSAVQGTHCDFCHKVVNVNLDAATNKPYENMPGVLSMDLRRPEGETQVFFGPFDDVDVGPDTYLPLQAEGKLCAPCHNASFWGTPIYQSYAEWLASPYPAEGKTCQTCHMKPDGVTTNFAPGRGGLERDPQKIFTHSFPGAADEALLRDTATVGVSAKIADGRLMVTVLVTNEKAGHDLPTDHPARNVLLVVSARDAQGKELPLVRGPVMPEWGGAGHAANDYAGRPGRGYAKVLQELWTEVAPSAAYWRQTVVLEDTRIKARATDESSYEFAAPAQGTATVEARLIFRRAFKELAEVKGWDVPDILMEHETITVKTENQLPE